MNRCVRAGRQPTSNAPPPPKSFSFFFAKRNNQNQHVKAEDEREKTEAWGELGVAGGLGYSYTEVGNLGWLLDLLT